MAKKNRITSPKGRAVYPRLNSPDTKFEKCGIYKIGLAVPKAEAEELIKTITKLQQEAIAEGKQKVQKGKKVKIADLPFNEDEETGEVTFNFKMKASGKTKEGEKWERRPAIFDAHAKPLKDAKIGGGSICKVSFEPRPYYVASIGAGVQLRLEAVQVLELVEFGGSASSYGFDAEEPDEEPGEETTEGGEEGGEDEADESGDGSDF